MINESSAANNKPQLPRAYLHIIRLSTRQRVFVHRSATSC